MWVFIIICAVDPLYSRIKNDISEAYFLSLNHTLQDAYIKSENTRNKKVSNTSQCFMCGSERRHDLIKINETIQMDKIKSMVVESENFIKMKMIPHARFGDRLKIAGSKQSYNLMLFRHATIFSHYFPKTIEIIENFAFTKNTTVIGISLAVMQPYTWLKFHEGFWEYAQYVSRAIVGLTGPEYGAFIRIINEPLVDVKVGNVVTFNDCEMHESVNSSPHVRIALIFDVQKNNYISDGMKGLNEIKMRNLNISDDEATLQRQNISLATIENVKDQMLDTISCKSSTNTV